jgi:hypothetical protein
MPARRPLSRLMLLARRCDAPIVALGSGDKSAFFRFLRPHENVP